jgi:PhnB protein
MLVQPYLFFDGNCEEAIDFYRQAIDAKLMMMMRFDESPEPAQPGMVPPGSEKKIMHAAFHVGESLIMASDGGCSGQAKFDGFSLSITVPDAATAERLFNALAEGGQVRMPIGKTFWSPLFGMVQDRFGVGWMVGLPPEEGVEPGA